MIERGGIHWADLRPPGGSRPAERRPVVVVQSEKHDRSRLATVVVVAVSSQTDLARHPGNVFMPAAVSGLPRDSVVNVTTLTTFNRYDLEDRVGTVPLAVMHEIDAGLRLVLGLGPDHSRDPSPASASTGSRPFGPTLPDSTPARRR
ncbi:type II toxin-antitoxin system PemK/MazF family toxin [Geodermatophilus sp. DF01_2]|uniref:type II toxin-antitoxin system PemK/MazF family toxin n=1 Tax=Geodermatophilus sp. DF01-2 TaxID=2559610 RepID=UPI002473FCDB|nr:type II toxin-antitoxin system PemK/MazF family toxin [Geodermatophilus sp. DF01_2]